MIKQLVKATDGEISLSGDIFSVSNIHVLINFFV